MCLWPFRPRIAATTGGWLENLSQAARTAWAGFQPWLFGKPPSCRWRCRWLQARSWWDTRSRRPEAARRRSRRRRRNSGVALVWKLDITNSNCFSTARFIRVASLKAIARISMVEHYFRNLRCWPWTWAAICDGNLRLFIYLALQL